MTNHVVRLYALAATLAVFFVAWAAIAAHPWQAEASADDPRLVQLAAREKQLRQEAAVVQRIVKRRWAVYDAGLKERQRQNAGLRRQAELAAAQPPATPAVRIVTLPPVTSTRTS